MNRQCGGCQLCCRLVPVKSLGKPAGQRCQHQRFNKGCAIYATRPIDCRLWSCAWLTDPIASSLSRPDHCGYVIDAMLDFVQQERPDGTMADFICAQIWIDPKRPDAHRDPKLRAYLRAKNLPALVRFNSDQALFLIYHNDRWIEQQSNLSGRPEHSAQEVQDAIHRVMA